MALLLSGGVFFGSEDPKKLSWGTLRAAAICINPESLLKKYCIAVNIA